jgi:hypothetical protein
VVLQQCDDVDIMIQNNGAWVGYQNVTNDTRGFDLVLPMHQGQLWLPQHRSHKMTQLKAPLEYGDIVD